MAIREATKEIYKGLLVSLEKNKTPATLLEIARVHKVDAKLPSFLVTKGLLAPYPGKKDHFIANYSAMPLYINQVIEEFAQYREQCDDRVKNDKADLAYYRKNRAFLVDSRNQLAMTAPEREALILETRSKLIAEVVEYVELAHRLGKTDIKSFVTTLLDVK